MVRLKKGVGYEPLGRAQQEPLKQPVWACRSRTFAQLRRLAAFDSVMRLMDKILHDPKDPKLWELWYIPYNG